MLVTAGSAAGRGHLAIVNDFWALVRGYGVQFMPICQSVLRWRRHARRLLAGGTATNILRGASVDERARLPLLDLAPLGIFLFGTRWQSALARAIHRSPRLVRRWVAELSGHSDSLLGGQFKKHRARSGADRVGQSPGGALRNRLASHTDVGGGFR